MVVLLLQKSITSQDTRSIELSGQSIRVLYEDEAFVMWGRANQAEPSDTQRELLASKYASIP